MVRKYSRLANFFQDVRAAGVSKTEFLTLLISVLGENSLKVALLLEEANNRSFLNLWELLVGLKCKQVLWCRSDLSSHVFHHTSSFPRSVVILTHFAVLKDLKGRVPRNSKFATRILSTFGTIDFSESHRRVISPHQFSCFGIFWLYLYNEKRYLGSWMFPVRTHLLFYNGLFSDRGVIRENKEIKVIYRFWFEITQHTTPRRIEHN